MKKALFILSLNRRCRKYKTFFRLMVLKYTKICNNLFICFDPLHINYTELSNHKHWIKGFLCPLSWPITTCFLCKDHLCLIVCLWVSKKIKSQIFLQMVELGYNFQSHWNAYASLKWIFIIVREIFYSNANQLHLWHMES